MVQGLFTFVSGGKTKMLNLELSYVSEKDAFFLIPLANVKIFWSQTLG